MSEVREWLAAIGLPQYAEAFEANHIEVDLLGQLDDQMLKDIGVSSAGHRLRIRNAIAKLSPVVPFAKNEPASGAEPKPQDTAERRQVTVMFSDLVGSTSEVSEVEESDGLLEYLEDRGFEAAGLTQVHRTSDPGLLKIFTDVRKKVLDSSRPAL